MTRANARELAVHLIYERCFTGEEPENAVAARLKKEYFNMLAEENQVYSDSPNATQKAYVRSVVSGYRHFDRRISVCIRNCEFQGVYSVLERCGEDFEGLLG